MITNQDRKEIRLWRLICLSVGILLAMTILPGCNGKEPPKEGKTPPASETKESHETKETGEKKEVGEAKVRGEKKESHETKEDPGMAILSQEKQKAAGIEVATVALQSVSIPLLTTAVVELNADRVSKVSSRVTGKVVKIIASQGDRVRAGQPLAYLDSVELDQAWADYVKAKGRLELAEKNLKREEFLFEKKISPEKDVLKARQELSELEADLNLSREKFRLLGVDVSEVEARKNGKGAEHHPLIPISSLITGVVIEKAVSQGEVVSPEKVLFTVADLSTLWVVVDAYEKDVSRLHRGTKARISLTAFPGREFRGTVSLIHDVIDEKTRTAKAVVMVDNPTGSLKPGMFATVTIDTATDRVEKAIAIPQAAVFLDGPMRYVFVQTGPDRFKRREITVLRDLGKKIEVIEGLKEGETIAVKGAFILKSEMKKEELAEE